MTSRDVPPQSTVCWRPAVLLGVYCPVVVRYTALLVPGEKVVKVLTTVTMVTEKS